MSYICSVKQGNLLQEKEATFIVNASNTRLILGSGVSMAFKKHCGNVLQQEMLEVYQKVDKPIEQGTVFATSVGEATNFKYALHASVMNYNPGTKYAEKIPTLDVINIILENIEGYLNWYNEKTSKPMKLVLPLMGCGVGGLEKKAVVETYKRFFDREVAFDCEVVVYGYSDDDFKLIQSICSGKSIAHDSWSNYYDFVNKESFGAFLNNLTIQTVDVVETLLPDTESSIIDFGAGTGRLSIPLAKLGYRVTSIEPSQGMLDILQAKAHELGLTVETVQSTLQDYVGKKQFNLGIAVFTVLSYLITEDELDAAIKVMNEDILDGGYMLIDIASRQLFRSSHTKTLHMDRDIKIKAIGDDKYLYHEVCSGVCDGKPFAYEDAFTIRHWTEELVITKMEQGGFYLKEELHEFLNSGASYLLFQKKGS